jgi:hypothetical protein
MLGAPAPNPLGILRAAEVLSVSRLGEPPTLALGFAGASTSGFRAESLVAQIAWIGTESLLAVSTDTSPLVAHR